MAIIDHEQIGDAPIFNGKRALRELAGVRLAGDPVKAAVDRVSRLTGLSYWRAYEIWYGRARRIEPSEETQIKQALIKKRNGAARNELAELKTRMLRLEAMLVRTDEEFFCEDIAALRAGDSSSV